MLIKTPILSGRRWFAAWVLCAGIMGSAAISCSKLDKSSNCLNEQSGCFKSDKTRPQVSSFQTQPLPGTNGKVTALQYIDVTFSEELKDGELASLYSFKPNASVHNFSVISVQKQSTYTYRLHVGGSLVSTGDIELDMSRLKDYNGNLVNPITPVLIQGSVNIGIVSSVNHNGVSTGGYTSIDIQFYHTYTADVTNDNSYSIRLTSGALDCIGGTVLTNGNNLQPGPGAPGAINLNVPVGSFTAGMNRLVICVNNQKNPNALNNASWPIIRDDVAPSLTFTPAAGSYAQPQSITLTCGNNIDKIAVTSSGPQNTVPANPATPAFNLGTGAITTGDLYISSITATNPANPSYTKFMWRCIDIAGNQSAAPAVVQYYIDSTIPDVVVNLDSNFRQNISTVNPNTTLTFSTDQISKTYNVRRNGTNCDTGGDGTLLATGTTSATAGQTSSVVLNETTDFDVTNNTTYPIRICVAGTGIAWGTAYLEITRDNTVPTIAATVLSGNYGALQSVEFTCTDGFGTVDKVAYNITEGDGVTVPAAPVDPDFNTGTGAITSGLQQVSPLTPADRKTSRYAFRCIDRAGNRSAPGNTQYTIDATLPVVNFVSANRPAVTTNVGGYADVMFTWSATRDTLTYRIRRVADCDHTGTPANTVNSGTITTANVNQSATIPAASFPSNGTTYPVRICVYNFVGATVYQATAVNVMRDDTPPALPTPVANQLPSIAAVDATNFTLTWNASTDTGGSGVATYRIFRSLTAGVYGATADYTATSSPATITMPDTQKYFLRIVPVDAAGNVSAAPYTETSTKPQITLQVAGLSGNFNLTDGAASTNISANTVSTVWVTTLTSGQLYNFAITSQPTGQVCSIKQ